MHHRLVFLLLLTAVTAAAQTLTCTVGSGSAPLRSSSVADKVGDVHIDCLGGTPPGSGAAPAVNVTVTLNGPATSRIVGSNNAGSLVEALLLIDAPAPNSQFPCTSLSCPFTIGQPLGNGPNDNRNVYQGVLTNANTVTFLGVPLLAPGNTGTRRLTVTNLRTAGSSFSIGNNVTAFIGVQNPPGNFQLNNATTVVATVSTATAFQQTNEFRGLTGVPPTYPGATPQNPSLNSGTIPSFLLIYTESSQNNEFFRRNTATSVANPSALASDNDPSGHGFDTETNFYNQTFSAINGLNVAGLATQGTRLEARFTGIPNGANVFVGVQPDPEWTFANASAIRLIDISSGALIPPTVSISGNNQMVQLPVSGGAATAVWEVLETANLSESTASVAFPVVVSYASPIPVGGTALVGLSLGPVDSTAAAASSTLPAPRFRTGPPITAFTITGAGFPPPIITTTSLPNGQQGIAYGPASLAATSGSPPYAWSLAAGALPTGLTLNASTGAITGTSTVNGTFNFTARVIDAQSQTATRPLSILIRPPVSFLTTSIPDGQVAVVYPNTTLQATGGLAPYTFSLASGTLPAGLSLTVAGLLAGTPTTASAFSFTARVTDSLNQQANVVLAGVIRPRVNILTTSLPSGTVNAAYSANVVGSGGLLPYAFSLVTGSMPAGLTLAANGAITGTPTASGTSIFVVRITDATTQTATAELAITIGTSVVITTTTLPVGRVGQAYASQLAAQGGSSPYTWALDGGTLPAGLTLSSAGLIAGTPTTPGTSEFGVRVTEAAGTSATRAFVLVVIGPPTITTNSPLPPGQLGVPYTTTLQGTGGSGAYSWTVDSGSLPAGLALGLTTGTISGTPTAAGTSVFRVRLTATLTIPGGPVSESVTKDFSITIGDIVILSGTLPPGQVAVAYATTLAASGGTPPYTWTVANGFTAPPGLTLSAAGALTGVPTTAGTFTFDVTATDSQQRSRTGTVSALIRNRLSISSLALPEGEVSREYLGTLIAAGGSGPYRWALLTGSLPPGLTLDAAGFIRGVPTGSGNFGFSLTATDATNQTASGEALIVIRGTFTLPPLSIPSAAVACGVISNLVATGGTPPYTWSAIGLPEGITLTPSGQLGGQPRYDGVYDVTFIATDSNGLAARQQVRFNVAPALAIVSPQSIEPVGIGQSVPSAFAASGGTPPYTFASDGGNLPAGLTLDAQGLFTGVATESGAFGAAVKVTDACGVVARRAYPLRILPSRLSECSLAPQPESLSFTLQRGTGAISRAVGLLGQCANPLTASVTVEQQTNAAWLSAGPGTLNTSPRLNTSFGVTVNPGSLPVGAYAGNVVFTGAVNATLPVSLSVVEPPSALQLSPVGLTFVGIQNGPAPASQNLNIVGLPRGPVSWSAAVSTIAGGAWLSLGAGGGATTGTVPGLSTLPVRVSQLGLAPGEYYGTIEVTAAGAANPSRLVTVVLQVLGADRTTPPTADQTGFIMVGPATRTALITNPTRNSLTYTTSRYPIEGRVFFSVDPPAGTIGPGGQWQLRITPDPASLREPGVRRTLLTVRFSDGSFLNFDLVQIVPRIAGVTTAAVTDSDDGPRELTGCTPSRLVGVFTTLQQNFSLPIGWPQGVELEVADDCTDSLNDGNANLGFSCCDSPKAMIPLGLGRWSATWVARAPANTEVQVTGAFYALGRTIEGSHAITGVIARTGNPPIIASGGAVSGATFSGGKPLAPGILTSVFGQRLADETTVSQSLPLTTTLGATSASLGGRLLPLFFTSDGQVNTQAPFDLPVNSDLDLIVRRGTALSTPETVKIAASAPGVFTRNQRGTGQAAIVDLQGRVIETGNAAASGAVAILFATGLGAVDQAVRPGFPAPSAEPLARTASPVTVAIGGVPAQVFFAGLAPGFVGLYQINLLIPPGVAPGDAVPITVTVAGASTSAGTMAIR